ncbi:hypothetical protein D3C84_1055270 [compost metagenome]
MHVQVAGDFKEEVAEVENAGADAIGGIAQQDIFGHSQFGEGDVDAVDCIDDECDQQEGHQAPDDLAIDARQIDTRACPGDR